MHGSHGAVLYPGFNRKRADYLIQKDGYAVGYLIVRSFWPGPRRNHETAAIDQYGAIVREKVVKHHISLD
jgi:hypothetical protein